MNKEAFS